jgi:hypothetical protein
MIEWIAQKGGWKNANHLIWFFTTMCFGFFAAFSTFHVAGRYVFLIPIGLHLVPIIAAIWTLLIQKGASEVYSRDCIPYNAVMIVFYAIVMYKAHM